MNKVELLAPAGNFEALKGAISAGADAVYLGGEAYGARAYAENFKKEEICAGIRLAHIFGVKIYLTVNTLVKEKELDGLYEFLLPFYECGLDGVIVQDLGGLKYIREHFKDIKICASTQMSITGASGANLMKAEGCQQIVPARELSLEEIKRIKEETGISIECFIHGAMCYCYSGQCLFSSILGGRSGNRGRCAQPCRLPYEIKGEKSCYPLSMKDMCTLDMLPELIEAGIDSFKIEGRMKKAAYAAGVTAIYRKYIDLYNSNPEAYKIEKADKDLLYSLYIRSEVENGYYHRKNGSEMITLSSPAYSPTDDKLLEKIEEKYVSSSLCKEACAQVLLQIGQPARMILKHGDVTVTSNGSVVQAAQKQPLSEEKVREQIQKSGNTFISITQVEVHMDADIFMPVSAINEMRREAVSRLEDALIKQKELDYGNRRNAEPCDNASKEKIGKAVYKYHTTNVQVAVNTYVQLMAALHEHPSRIYIESSLLSDETIAMLESYQQEAVATELFLATPYIIRQRDSKSMCRMAELLQKPLWAGILVRNLESFQFFRTQGTSKKIVLDTNMYLWNRESVLFFEKRADEFFLPLECNSHEWKTLLESIPECSMSASAVVYGRIPMMISANCVNKTMNRCQHTSGFSVLTDRYGKQFPVYTNCRYCYNIIYNSVPLSLHKIFAKNEFMTENVRLDFTTENEKQTSDIIRYFRGITEHYREPAFKEYTTGHYKRGVE